MKASENSECRERFVGVNSKNHWGDFFIWIYLRKKEVAPEKVDFELGISTKQPRWSLFTKPQQRGNLLWFAVTLTQFPTFFFLLRFFYFSSFLILQRNSISLFHWVCVIPLLFSISQLPFFFFHFNFPSFPLACDRQKIGWKGIMVSVLDFLSLFSWRLIGIICWRVGVGFGFYFCFASFFSLEFSANPTVNIPSSDIFFFCLAFLLQFPFSLCQLVGILWVRKLKTIYMGW